MKNQTVLCGTRKSIATAVLLGAASAASAVDMPRISAGVNVGSLGAGATLAVEVNRNIEARVGLNQAATSFEIEVDGLSYDGDISLNTTTAIVDFYPWRASGFRLSAGAFFNKSEVTGVATPVGPVNFGGLVFQPEDIGSAASTITFPNTAPYIGLGWGRRTGFQGRLKFSVDAGVFLQGKPEASISVENPNNIISDADIEQARQDMQAELDNLAMYPVLTLGISYSF